MREEEQQVTQEQPVRSAPVPVPGDGHRNDRGARTDVPEDALDDRGTFDDPRSVDERAEDTTDRTGTYGAPRRRDVAASDDRPVYHDPAPLPTAFGATTASDAAAAAAMASGRPEDERDPRGEDTARPGDGAPGRTDAFDDERADPTAGDRLHDPDNWSTTVRDDAPAAGAAGYGRAEPEMVDPDAGSTPPDTDRTGRAVTGADRAGASAAALVGAARPTPGAVPADAATLFAPPVAQGFRNRWRDVQLRFVDDPRAAVGEAQSLVEEAIEALSAALREQKRRLGGWQESGSADTEQLRVAVRGYRDFLDRVLGR